MTPNIAPSARNYRHLQDLIAQTNTLHPTQKATVKSWLETAQRHWHQANAHKGLGDLDEAYIDFLMAMTIVVQIIPACPDWPTIRMSNTTIKQQHDVLKKNISAITAEYDLIKEKIRQDNESSGIQQDTSYVQPYNHKVSTPQNSSHSAYAPYKPHTRLDIGSELESLKPSPIFSGKTKSLGVLSSISRNTNTSEKDLQERFDKLSVYRDGENPIVAQGRVSLHPSNIRPSKGPYGPREMPTPLIVNDILPQLPAPTYSPATSYGSPGRLSPLRSSMRSSTVFDELDGQISDLSQSKVRLSKKIKTSPMELSEYIKDQETSILLLDVRPREDFNQGHIFTRSIVCLEPITIREEMSEEDLEQSLVLIDTQEPQIFTMRHKYDIVVYYDQSTPHYASAMKKPHLRNLSYALYDYAHAKKTRQPPVFLEGGLEAWIELFGPQSLKLEQPRQNRTLSVNLHHGNRGTVVHKPSLEYMSFQGRQSPHPFSHSDIPVTTSLQSAIDGATGRVVGPEIHDNTNGFSNELSQTATKQQRPDFVRSIEDYFKQSPSKPGDQQSMSSPQISSLNPLLSTQNQNITDHTFNIFSDIRNPRAHSHPSPIRPAPVAPRRSYSGVSEPLTNTTYPISIVNERSMSFEMSQPNPYIPESAEFSFGTTGLHNLGNTCYMNSILQCMSGTIPLSRYFLDGRYRSHLNSDSPRGRLHGQLAAAFADVIRHLWGREYKFISPVTFQETFRKIHHRFNRTEQQDAHEFFLLLLDELHEALNPNANRTKLNNLTEEEERRRDKLPVQVASSLEWKRHTHKNSSVVVNWMQGQQVCKRKCSTCSGTTSSYEVFNNLSVSIPTNVNKCQLIDILGKYAREEELDGWTCPHCKASRKATTQTTITRLPHILVIHLKRFSRQSEKIRTLIDFPQSGLDLTEFIPPPLNGDHQQAIETKPPFIYDIYGVSNHVSEVVGSGHYTAYVKSYHEGLWRRFNDKHVDVVNESILVSEDAYILFWVRRQIK